MKSPLLVASALCLCALIAGGSPALAESCFPNMPQNAVSGHGGFELISLSRDHTITITYGDIEYIGNDVWFSHHAVQLYDGKFLDELRNQPGFQQPFDVRQAADVDVEVTGGRSPTVNISVNRSANQTRGTSVDIDKVDDPTVRFLATCSADGILRGSGVTASGVKTEYILTIDSDH